MTAISIATSYDGSIGYFMAFSPYCMDPLMRNQTKIYGYKYAVYGSSYKD